MNGRIFISIIIVLSLGLAAACGNKPMENAYKYLPYYQSDALPKMVYVGDQVNTLNTNGQIPEGRNIFVEIRTRDGKQENGKLIQISTNDLIVSTGFRYIASKDSTLTVENPVKFSKKNILILKIW
jgi:hypothetical protein